MIASDVLGSMHIYFCLLCLMMKKVLMGCFHLFDGISVLSVFPHVLWWGEDKTKVIQEIVSNVIRGFYYRLIFSRSDFEKWRTH